MKDFLKILQLFLKKWGSNLLVWTTRITYVIPAFFLPTIILSMMVCCHIISKNMSSLVGLIWAIICSCLILALIFYICVYVIWRKIPTSLLSFFWFFLFIIQCYLFSSTFYVITFLGLSKSIYLEDISIIGRYRYLLMLVLALIMGCYLIIRYFIPKISFIANRYFFPHIKEEICRILYTWNHALLGDLCIIITNKLHDSLLFQKIFFILHFVLFYITKMLRLVLFVHFCFFEGDLRYLVYFSFISFLVWIISFFDYYLLWFIKANLNVSNEVLYTSYADPIKMTKREDSDGYVEIKNPNEVIFTLSPEAIKYGFTENQLPSLCHSWYRLNNVLGIFQRYKTKVQLFDYLLLGSYITCWFVLVKFFFFPMAFES